MSELNADRAKIDEMDYSLRCEEIKIKLLSRSLDRATSRHAEITMTRNSAFAVLASLPRTPALFLQLPPEVLSEIWLCVFAQNVQDRVWEPNALIGSTEFGRWFDENVVARRTGFARLSCHPGLISV